MGAALRQKMTLSMPEIAIGVPIDDIYADADLPPTAKASAP